MKPLIFICTILSICLCMLSCSSNDNKGVYVIDNKQFGISNDKTNARATTDGINAALREAKAQGHTTIKLAKGEYLIECTGNNRWVLPTDGIIVPSDITLDLSEAKIYLKPNDYEIYGLLQLINVENVTIIGGHLVGDRYEHSYEVGKSHEYGFGVQIISSTNVTIKDMKIEGMTGDAVILISEGGKPSNEQNANYNVTVTGCELFDCRRQGISVVNAVGVEIANNKIYNIHGTAPQFGIDVEPEVDYGCVAKNIRIHHNTISDCVGGISFHGGTDMEAYENTLDGICLIAVYAQRVRITKNTVTSPGYISAGQGSEQRPCQDICIPTDGEYKNNCKTVVNKSIQTGGFKCP